MKALPEHLRLPPGVRDLEPELAPRVREVHAGWMTHARRSAYREVRLAPVGFRSTFTRGHHAAGESLFKVLDRGERELCLTSDSLAAALRLVAASEAPEIRLAFTSPIFRCRHGRSTYWSQIGALEASRAPSGEEDSAARVTRLAVLVSRFLGDDADTRLWVNDLALLREPLTELAPEGADDLLQRLGKTPAADWTEVLAAAETRAPVLRRLAALAALGPLPLDLAREHLRAWPLTEAASPATRARFARLLERADELARRTRRRPLVALGSLHGREFCDGLTFQLRDPSTNRVVADGGDFSRYAAALLGPGCGVWSTAFGLEAVARRRTGVVPVADVLVQAAEGVPREVHEALCEELRSEGLVVWDAADGGALPGAIALARALGIGLLAYAHLSPHGEVVVRVGDGATATRLAPAEAVAWLAERRAQGSGVQR